MESYCTQIDLFLWNGLSKGNADVCIQGNQHTFTAQFWCEITWVAPGNFINSVWHYNLLLSPPLMITVRLKDKLLWLSVWKVQRSLAQLVSTSYKRSSSGVIKIGPERVDFLPKGVTRLEGSKGELWRVIFTPCMEMVDQWSVSLVEIDFSLKFLPWRSE